MVQISTPWGAPNWGMGAFCQITLTSCLRGRGIVFGRVCYDVSLLRCLLTLKNKGN